MAVFIGLSIVVAVVSVILVSTRKNRVELTGEILKVRSHQMDPEHTLALIDVRVHNPSTQQFMVHQVEVFIDGEDGKSTAAEVFTEPDAQRIIDYYTAVGKKYNPGLLRRDKLDSGQSSDRSLAIRAPMTDEQLQKRKAIRLQIHDIDGATTQVVERRAERG